MEFLKGQIVDIKSIFSIYNANEDRPCSECKKPIPAGSDYVGEYGSAGGYKRHFGCKPKD